MKKFGFTLAEILITLGIIGVVASLSIPTFVANVKNATNASCLSASVSALENAFTTMIAKEDVDSVDLLLDTDAWASNDANGFISELSDYLDIIPADIPEAPHQMTANGRKSNATVDWPANSYGLLLKSGALVVINVQNGAQTTPNNPSNSPQAAVVWIDVNSTSEPNTIGRDVFQFALANNGKLYPSGARTVQVVNDGYKINY